MKKGFVIKIIISLILIGYLVFKIRLSQIIEVFAQSKPIFLLASLIFLPFMFLLKAIKWNILLKSIGIRLKLKDLIKACLVGAFYSLITPAKAGDFIRAFYLKQPKSVIIPTVIWDKIIDVSALILLSLSSLFFLLNRPDLLYLFFIILILLIIIIILTMNKKVLDYIIKIFKIPKDFRDSYLNKMHHLLEDRKALLKNFFITLIFYAGGLLMSLLIILALNKNVPLILVFAMPIIALFGNLPISIGGLGVREFVSVEVFTRYGAPEAYGFSFSLLIFLIGVLIPGIVGYYFTIKH